MLILPPVVTYAQALETARSLNAQLGSEVAAVLLDASALTQFDSSALAVILACRRQAMAAGKTFSVQALPARLSQLASLYGVVELVAPAA